MSAEFVPILSSLRAKQEPTPGSGSADFKAAVAAPAASTPHAHSDVKVELKREGDFIRQIRIQCKCGEVIELVCEY